MFCPKCGTNVPDNSMNCPTCGQPLATQQQPYQQPYQQPVMPLQTARPMAWYKFLIYFALFASAILNAYNGIRMITGTEYGEVKELVYAMFDGLQSVDILVGILVLGVAAIAIFARVRLAGFYKNGPALITALYAANVIVNLVYIVALYLVLPEGVFDYIEVADYVVNIVVACVMIGVNAVYFGKRKDLFIH